MNAFIPSKSSLVPSVKCLLTENPAIHSNPAVRSNPAIHLNLAIRPNPAIRPNLKIQGLSIALTSVLFPQRRAMQCVAMSDSVWHRAYFAEGLLKSMHTATHHQTLQHILFERTAGS